MTGGKLSTCIRRVKWQKVVHGHTWGHVAEARTALPIPQRGSRIPQSWGECLVQLPHLLSMGLKLRAHGLQPMTIDKVTGVAGATGH